jgi:hypothetical protein
MGTLAQTVLPFKVQATEELLTANAGLVPFGEFVGGLGLNRWLSTEMPKPGTVGTAIRPTSSMTAKTPARPSPSAGGWMHPHNRPLPESPQPPGRPTPIAPLPRRCTA